MTPRSYQPLGTTKPAPEPDQLDLSYQNWKTKPDSNNLKLVISNLQPTIDSAITSFAGYNMSPVVRSRAKYLAAQAVKSFDPKKGASLKSHVMLQLQPVARYAVKASQPMKTSERYMKMLSQLIDVEEAARSRGVELSDTNIADELGWSIKQIKKVRKYASQPMNPYGDEETADKAIYFDDPTTAWIDYIYHDANSVDKKIMEWRMGLNNKPVISNQEIARKLNLSPGAVSQRVARIQQKIDEFTQGVR